MPNAARFRRHAKECRELAKVAPDERFRMALVKMVEEFEDEADRLEQERG
jgi:hypothetical protein